MAVQGRKATRAKVEKIRAYWRERVERHLCDRALVTDSRWRAMFLRLVDDVRTVREGIGRIGDPPEEVGFDPREPLVWAWCVLDTMPNERAVAYEAMRERSVDGTGIEDRADVIRERGYEMPGLTTAVDQQVPWLAALARVLDDDLAALQYWPEDVREWKVDDWRPLGYACHVVPVRRPYRLGDRRPAQRRGLLHHAIVPVRIGSLGVELRVHPDAARGEDGADPSRWTYGAATFPDMTVVPSVDEAERFRVVGAPIAGDEAAVLARQVADARAASTDVLVWPELTMPGSRLDLLRERLADAPLFGGRIPLVVAGSWHVLTSSRQAEEVGEADMEGEPLGGGMSDGETATNTEDRLDAAAFDLPPALAQDEKASDRPPPDGGPDVHVNRSEVMLGDGEPLLSYDKRRPFPFDGLMEDITPGRFLPVIVMEDRLVGVAICRDNCDDNALEGYRHLPIDLVVVPSMGAESTVDAHERHAKAQRSRQGTVTLVVQQRLAVHGEARPPGTSAYSFVRPEEAPRPGLEQDVEFRTLG